MNVQVSKDGRTARVIPIKEAKSKDGSGFEEGNEAYSDLIEFLDHIFHIADQSVLQEYTGTKVTICIGEEGWCIEAEDDEEFWDSYEEGDAEDEEDEE